LEGVHVGSIHVNLQSRALGPLTIPHFTWRIFPCCTFSVVRIMITINHRMMQIRSIFRAWWP
jgi:hypothetical protein